MLTATLNLAKISLYFCPFYMALHVSALSKILRSQFDNQFDFK